MKTRLLMILILLGVLYLSGCSSSNSEDKEIGWSTMNGEDTEITVEETASIENTTDKNTYTEDAQIKENILSTYWKMLLQETDSLSPGNSLWNKDYDVEAYLENFDLNMYRYTGTLVYPEKAWYGFVWYWPDYIEDIRESSFEAEKYIQYHYAGKREYESQSEELVLRKKESVLQICGHTKKCTYAEAGRFVDNLYPYNYSGVWGSVLKEAGALFEKHTGSYLGNMVGKAYMMNFDFGTLTGTFWICLENQEPVQVILTFENRDCDKYVVEISENNRVSDGAEDNAWLGMEFDLVTTRTQE